jgi:hypothetical protein
VVLDQDPVPGHPHPFGEEGGGVAGVVDHVDEEQAVEARVGEGDPLPVEERDRDAALLAWHHVDPLELQIRARRDQARREGAVPAADVEDARAGRDQPLEEPVQAPHAAVAEVELVKLLDGVHGRDAAGSVASEARASLRTRIPAPRRGRPAT